MLLKLVDKMKAKSVPDYIAKVQAHGDRAIARLKNAKNSEAKIGAIQDQTETLVAIAQDAKNVQDIKDRCINLFQDSDKNPRPAVVLSSVHKAKGLEWSKVFLIRSTFLRPGRESREEENIYYVACTRTKNELVFVADPPKEP
jgi:superfamily I DNA/RNA helicase